MLDFIVLGQVPGTDIQLTFLQVLIVAAIFVLTTGLSYEIGLRRKIVKQLLNQQQIMQAQTA
jgi:hypothetical protein